MLIYNETMIGIRIMRICPRLNCLKEVYKEGMRLETKKTHSYIHYKLLNLATWLSEHLEANSSTIISENKRDQDVPWEHGQKVEPRGAWFP